PTSLRAQRLPIPVPFAGERSDAEQNFHIPRGSYVTTWELTTSDSFIQVVDGSGNAGQRGELNPIDAVRDRGETDCKELVGRGRILSERGVIGSIKFAQRFQLGRFGGARQ